MDEVIQNQLGGTEARTAFGKHDLSQGLKHAVYIEIFVVVDHYLFSFQGSNETSVILLVTDVVNLSEASYYPLKICICLVGLEIWTHSNFIRCSQDREEVLRNFNDWANRDLSQRMEYDVAPLFTYVDFGLIVGLAYVGSICRPGYQAGVVSQIRTDFITFSIIFTHELGHNLGMEHDKKERVYGEATKCYMTGDSLDSAKAFSNGSRQSCLDLIGRGDGDSLRNVPEPHRLFRFKRCPQDCRLRRGPSAPLGDAVGDATSMLQDTSAGQRRTSATCLNIAMGLPSGARRICTRTTGRRAAATATAAAGNARPTTTCAEKSLGRKLGGLQKVASESRT